jgi:hypothetical protein
MRVCGDQLGLSLDSPRKRAYLASDSAMNSSYLLRLGRFQYELLHLAQRIGGLSLAYTRSAPQRSQVQRMACFLVIIVRPSHSLLDLSIVDN